MKKNYAASCWLAVCLGLMTALSSSLSAQTAGKNAADEAKTSAIEPLDPALAAASDLTDTYAMRANVPYVTTENGPVKLDVYKQKKPGAHATLIYIHGGGWRSGSKDQYALWFEPFLFLGWNVVNVDYRLKGVALAPAAVEDTTCALRWVIHNAKLYGFDTNRIVVMGNSAGGHLALMTGMATEAAGFDKNCPGPEPLKVAAIVDWFGVSDVNALLQGPQVRDYATQWIGDAPGQQERAKAVSPMTYVRAGLPPTILIQGDADPAVPYDQSVRLHAALAAAKVPTEFVTIPGGKHGNFGTGPTQDAYAHIFDFLKKTGVGTEAVR